MSDSAEPAQINTDSSSLVPMYDENLQPVMVHPHDVQDNLNAGFTMPTPEEVHDYHNEQKYGGVGQQALTALEGAASAATFGLSTGAERALGVDPKDIQGRRETNPVTHGVGQLGGLIGSSLLIPGGGAAGLMEGAGAAGAGAVNAGAKAVMGAEGALKAAQVAGEGAEAAQAAVVAAKAAQTAGSRIGSVATKMAIDNMLFQSGDEISKAFSADPNQSVQTAIADVALSGAIGGILGGAAGGTKELWNMGPGKKLGQLLDALKGRTEPTPEMLSIAERNTSIENTNAILGGMDAQLEEFQKAQTAMLNRQEPDLIYKIKENNKLEQTELVDTIKARAKGEGPPEHLAQAAGVDVPLVVQAALGDNPETRHMFQVAMQGSSKADAVVQNETRAFQENLKTSARDALGKSETDFKNIDNLSDAKAGESARSDLLSSIKARAEAVGPAFDELKSVFKYTPILKENQASIANSISELMTKEGLHKAPSSEPTIFVKKVLSELPLQETAEDLYKYIQNVGREADRQELYHIGKELKSVLRGELDNLILTQEPKYGSEWLAKSIKANQDYAQFMGELEQLNDRLKLGSFAGPKDFLKRLGDKSGMTAEKLINRINIANDADLSGFLKSNFPSVAKTVEDHQLNNLIAASRTADRGAIDVKKLFKNMSDLSPELRDAIVPKDAQGRIMAIHELERRLPENMNKSGTAKTLFDLMEKLPASGVGMASGMLGGPVGAAIGYAVKKASDYAAVEAPGAVRIAMLKMLASPEATSASGFQTAVKTASAFIKGETKVNKAVANVFKAGAIAGGIISAGSNRSEKLKKQVDEIAVNPDKLLDVGGDVGHYLPEHGTALAQTVARSVQYLSSIKPDLQKKSPLDNDPKENPVQKSEYNRAIDIAEQPLIVLSDIKKGTITPQDITHLKTMYPALYTSLSQKLLDEMAERVSNGDVIPYATRMGLSLFVGQPLDSTMKPSSLMALNPPPQAAPGPQQQASAPKHSSMKSLGKISQSYMTATQSREAKKFQS